MSERINCSVPDEQAEWVEEHPYSPSKLLQWAIRTHQGVGHPETGDVPNLGQEDELIRDPHFVLNEVDLQYRHYVQLGNSLQLAALKAAQSVVDKHEFSENQSMYFAEIIIADGPPINRNNVTQHIFEDAGFDPTQLCRQLLVNVLEGYLHRVKGEEDVEEPLHPPENRPPVLPSREPNYRKLADNIYDMLEEATDNFTRGLENQPDKRTEVIDKCCATLEGLSWTEKITFVEYISDSRNIDLAEIPGEQIGNHMRPAEIPSTLSYWCVEFYLQKALHDS
jgi:hypothetical protein